MYIAGKQNLAKSSDHKGNMKGIFFAVLLLGVTMTVRGDGLIVFSNNGSTSVKAKGFQEPDSSAVLAPAGSAIVEVVWAPAGTPMRAWTGRQRLSTWLALNPGWQECEPSREAVGPAAGRFIGGGVNIPTPVHGGTIDMVVIGWDSRFESFDEAAQAGGAVGFSAKFAVTTANPYLVPPPLPASILGPGQFTGMILTPIDIDPENRPPVLFAIPNQNAAEETLLLVSVSATDPDAGQKVTFLLGPGAPPGAALDPTTGLFMWTPPEAAGPGLYPVSVIAVDDGVPALSTVQGFNIFVSEVNRPPAIAGPGSIAADEGVALSLQLAAADPDVPGNNVIFEKQSGPAGLTVNSSGVISWTPAEADGPGAFEVVVRAFDNGVPSMSSTATFAVNVREVNSAPMLSPIANQVIDESATLNLLATATDADLPPNSLMFERVSGPPGLIVSPTGQISWTPNETNGPGVFSVSVRVSDSQSPALTATQSFNITVNEVNAAPTLAGIADKTGDEGTSIGFAVSAIDADVPAQVLTFSLAEGAPTGATINSAGVFEWTPTEGQGPGTYPVTVRVSDGQETVALTIQVTVNEANKPPVLAAIGDKTIDAGAALSFSASAVDEDQPAQTLVYSLGPNAPAGASLSASGSFSWTPATEEAGATYPITIVVSDGIAKASATFQVEVRAPLPLTIVSHPQNQLVEAGTNALFEVVATGETPISYQWRFNSADLPGQTQSSLTIPSVQPSNVGTYEVVVRNDSATLTSLPATLAIKQDFGGSAIDGYIAGGTVFFDANFNGTRDGNEPAAQTDGQGSFQLTVNLSLFDTDGNGTLDPNEGRLVLTGGQDIATGLEHKTALMAPPGSTVITPLTTLLQTMVESDQNTQPEVVEARIKDAFGIASDLDLTTFDPLMGTLSNAPGAVAVLKAGAQVQDTMVQVAALLGGASNSPPSSAVAGQTVMEVLGSMLLNDVPVELTSPTDVLQVITQALSVTGAELPPSVAAGAATVISDLNQIKDAVDESPANGNDAARLLAQAQGIAQGVVSQTLEEAAQSLQAVDDLTTAFSGTNLVQTVVSAPVGDLSGEEIRVGTFSFTRGEYRCREDGTSVPGFGLTLTRTDGTKGSVTVLVRPADGTALADEEDFVAAPVAVTFGDGEITKSISLAGVISEDPVVEGEETILLSLSLAPDAPSSATLGIRTNATLTVADNDYPGAFAFAQGNYRLNENQGGKIPVTVTRSGGVGGTVTVVVTPSSLEGAVAGVDFDATPILLQFDPGNIHRTFIIPVLADQLLESQERFRLTLSLASGAPAGATLGVLSQTEVLVDNDASRVPQAFLEFHGRQEDDVRRLRATGTPGQKFVLESSSDLTHWTELQAGTLQQAPAEISAPAAANIQFYRMRLVP